MKTLIAASIVAITTSQVNAMDTLSSLEWQNRVVLVFGNSSDSKIAQQIELLEGQEAELADRDMVIIRVTGEEARAVYGKASGLDASAIRKEANVSGDRFQVLLVGKDGGVKFRSDSVVRNVEIFDLIDSMPMRRAEQS
jgi:hypothetical protein